MESLHPHTRGVWKPKPLSALRRPSSLLKPANPTAPPDRTTPPPNNKPLHQIPITYFTIAAKGLSFHSQVLTAVIPVQLAQNGLYCKLLQALAEQRAVLPADRLSPCTHSRKILSKRCSNFTWHTVYGRSSIVT